MTEFAVASWNELQVMHAVVLGGREVEGYDKYLRSRMITKGWLKYAERANGIEWWMTETGALAAELRQTLGQDRELTKAQARAIRLQITPARHFKALLGLGLIDEGDALTEDGEWIAHLLRNYEVTF